ncbi:MAG: transaldolase [Rubrobacteraceae bacterium]|nr:transaldolase [Rubrobacteraceae bacterium]
MNERLDRMRKIGQAPWVDEISREDTQRGGLEKLVEQGIVGVTSNPTIFQQAISNSELYDEQLAELARELDDPKEIFFRVAQRDIQDACDILAPVYEETDHLDGFVSLEVSPDLAYDTEGTIEEAQRLHDMVDRPNLFIKIPATREGLPAIEEMISRGVPINVTLIFSIERYREVTRAYIDGLKRFVEGGGDPSTVASVASFFVSRVDTETDRRLDEVGRPDLKGRLAVDNAKLVYQEFKEIFGSDEWRELEARGARKQRPLWASTSTKNPEYSDVKYVEELVGPDTVNTMPKKTIEAVMDHAEIRPTIEEGVEEARALFTELEKAGVDYDDVTATLEREGVQKFSDSFEELIEVIEQKSGELARR